MTFSSFLKNTSANIAVTTALLSIPLLAAIGSAIDYARLINVQSQYQEAADAAVLAAASQFKLSATKQKRLADNTFLANINSTDASLRGNLSILNDGFRYEANTTVGFMIMSVLGFKEAQVAVVAEVAKSAKNVEIALVLDTTGSMQPNIASMKQSARKFVETLDSASNGSAKFAVVPFVASVNAGRLLSNAEIDRSADSEHHANIMENVDVFYDEGASCGSPEAEPDGGSTEEGASLGTYLRQVFGINSAHAQASGAKIGEFPAGWTSKGPCLYITPPKLNHLTLFSNINVRWEGCVEARPGDLDVSNLPANNDPNSKWVPYFWPEEEPRGDTAITHNNYFSGNYEDTRPTTGIADYNWAPTNNVNKYQRKFQFQTDETAPETRGPNKACPDQVLPLSGDASIVKQKIATLSHWNGGGTIASEGVAWGMRILTPEAPFTEGRPVDTEVDKILVLFGDGKNEMPVNIDNSPMITDYSAYGYAGGSNLVGRGVMDDVLNTPSGNRRISTLQTDTQEFLDERMLQACTNAKAENITVLTILFNETDEQTRAVYRDCASESDDAIIASDAAGLDAAFEEIASKVLQLYLRR